ncbi:MAG: MFS transporter [Solirubrobacterales bacterium]
MDATGSDGKLQAVNDPTGPAVEPRQNNWAALVLGTLAFMSCFYAWALLGPLGPDLQDELGISDFELALAVSIPVVLGSLMRVPIGILTDRHGGRRVFTVLMAFVPLPLIALALTAAESYAAVLVFGFLLGFAGASFAIGIPFVSKWFPPERQGMVLGIYGMGMGGTVLAGLTAPRIVDATSLAVPFWIAAGVLAVMAVVFWTAARDAPGATSGASKSLIAPLRVFREPGAGRAWALTLFYFMAFGGFVAMFIFLPKLLVSVHDLSKPDAGTRAAGFALLAVLARPTGGVLSDRIGARTILNVSFAGTAACALGLALTYESMVPLTIFCLSAAVMLGLGTGAVFKLVAEWFPAQVGTVTGVVGAAGGLGGFFPPLVMTLVKTWTGTYLLGFLLMGVVALVCLAVLAGIRRERPEPVSASAVSGTATG